MIREPQMVFYDRYTRCGVQANGGGTDEIFWEILGGFERLWEILGVFFAALKPRRNITPYCLQ